MDAANSELSAGPKPGKKRGSASELRQRLDAAKEITMLFKMERYVYMACCGLAVMLLFYCAFRLLQSDKGFDPVVIGSLFGSGGLITFSTGRLIFMWNKILEIILMEGAKGGDDDGDK